MDLRFQRWLRRVSFDLAYGVSLVFGTVLLAFILFQVFPADPARLALGPGASEAAVDNLRERWGLDDPLPVRLSNYLLGVVRLDFGTTFREEQSVSRVVWERFQVTASLGLRAAFLALIGSYLISFLAQVFRTLRWLPAVLSWAVAFTSFLLAILGALLLATLAPSVALTGSEEGLWTAHWLPAVILSIYPMALMLRVLDGKFSEIRKRLYYQAQLAAGFSRLHLFHRVLLRPAAISWLAVLFNQLSLLFLATMIVEVIYTIPGSGQLLTQAVQRGDFPLIQGILVFNGVFFVALFFLSERIYERLSPPSVNARDQRAVFFRALAKVP